MSLSKPTHIIYELVGAYFERLYTSPVKTKAVTSCVIASLSNFISQKLSGAKIINQDSLIAFGLFGLLFGGPLPHYFYLHVHRFTKSPLTILLVERFLYMPIYQAFALYMLSRFEGKPHDVAVLQLKRIYMPILLANLKYLTLLQYVNIRFVPPMLRVLVVNLIGLMWSVYLATQRSKVSRDKTARK